MEGKTFLEFASGRRSIRKFKPNPVPERDIRYFISSAVTAPSGCNSQCWKFVAVTDRKVLGRISKAVAQACTRVILAGIADMEEAEKYAERKAKGACFFENAPLVIAVF
jgi:nitroreductase